MKKIALVLCFIPSLFFSQENKISSPLATRIDSLKKLLSRLPDDTNKIKTYLSLSADISSVNLDSGLNYGIKAVSLSEKLGSEKGLVSGQNLLGNFYLRQSRLDDGLKAYASSLKILKTQNNKKGIAIVYGGIANCYTMKGDLDSALKYRILALKIAEESGSKKIIATAYGNLGQLYFNLNNFPKALENFRYHLKINEELGNKPGMIIPLCNVAYVLMELKQSNEALPLLLKAKQLSEETGDREGLAMVLHHLGVIYNDRHEYRKAEEYYLQSLKNSMEIGDVQDISIALTALGDVNMQLKNYDQALDYYKLAYEKALVGGANDRIQNALEGIAKVHEKMGNISEALKYYKLYLTNKDSILNADISRQIAEMTTKYETEKKENTIKLLNKDAEIREAKFKGLRNSFLIGTVLLIFILAAVFFYIQIRRSNEKMKMQKQMVELEQIALRLQMNPHFIFNSLGSISDFIGKNEPAEAKRFLLKFAKLMRLTLESSKETYVPLSNEIDALRYYMELEQLRFNNKFSFNIHVAENTDQELLKVPPMLIQPHVENAILHGVAPKETNGSISLSFVRKNGSVVCEITDDGIGRKKAMQIKKTSGLSHKSMAIAVTVERLKILGAAPDSASPLTITDLHDNSGNPSGTKVSLEIPSKE